MISGYFHISMQKEQVRGLAFCPRTLHAFWLFGRRNFRAEFFVFALVTHHFESALSFFISS